MLKGCYVFLCGAFFAFLQFSFFFTLESNLSSAALTYMATTCSWIFGIVIGLSIKKRQSYLLENLLAFGAVLFFYILSFAVHKNPFDNSFLWLYMVLIGGSSLYAGYFFNSNRDRFAKVKNLFFWENNGFILGLVLSFFGMTLIGNGFIYLSLTIFCVFIVVLQLYIAKKEESEKKEFDPILCQYITKT